MIKYYTTYTPKHIDKLRKLILKYGLHFSAGSSGIKTVCLYPSS